jgi:hypothetical protein
MDRRAVRQAQDIVDRRARRKQAARQVPQTDCADILERELKGIADGRALIEKPIAPCDPGHSGPRRFVVEFE